MIAQIQLRPEPEAQEIYHRIRTDTHGSDLSASIHEATNESVNGTLQNQPQQQQQQQVQQQQQQQRPHRQTPQHQDSNTFFQPDYTTTEPTNQLPPLRSIVVVPTASIDTTPPRQLPQSFRSSTQRNMSQVSVMSSGSYMSLSSSDGHSEQSVSPEADRPPRWAHCIND